MDDQNWFFVFFVILFVLLAHLFPLFFFFLLYFSFLFLDHISGHSTHRNTNSDQLSRRGFTRQPENSKRAHFRASALQTPPKFDERTPKSEKKGKKIVAERGKKSANFWASTLRGPPLQPSVDCFPRPPSQNRPTQPRTPQPPLISWTAPTPDHSHLDRSHPDHPQLDHLSLLPNTWD